MAACEDHDDSDVVMTMMPTRLHNYGKGYVCYMVLDTIWEREEGIRCSSNTHCCTTSA